VPGGTAVAVPGFLTASRDGRPTLGA
jgi:hypothetical protein